MRRIIMALVIGCVSLNVMAESPNDVIQSAADELAAGLEGRKDELAADRDALDALIDQILMARFDKRYVRLQTNGTDLRLD